MLKKNFIVIIAVLLFLSMALVGCTSNNSDTNADDNNPTEGGDEKETVSMFMYVTSQSVQEAYLDVAKKFEEENPDIKLDLQFQGADYESLMKVKMAASELPDIFDTHGWAKIRYGQYLLDLQGESWVERLTETIKPIVTDENGKVYVLPVSEAKDGIAYNVAVLEKYDIEPPKTVDEMLTAFEKIKTESNGEVTPLIYSGVDNWTVGQFYDYFAVSLLNVHNDNEAGEALLNGTFDWSKWTPLPALFKEIQDKGYLNKDLITAKFSDYAQLFAENKVAFATTAPSFADDVYAINEDSEIGIMPVPAWNEGEPANFSGGERNTMGIWKDSKNIEASKKVLEFYAKPENMATISNAVKIPAGLTGVTATHEYAKYYEQYADIPVYPYFDRVYLPSGMWDVMCNAGMELAADIITPEEYSQTMEAEVERLKK